MTKASIVLLTVLGLLGAAAATRHHPIGTGARPQFSRWTDRKTEMRRVGAQAGTTDRANSAHFLALP
jgi:hypothetical protein